MDKNILSKKFRRDFVELLLDAGFKDEEANKLVTKKYKEKLKEETLNHLEKIINLIKEDKFDDVNNLLALSISGDGYGCDNNYIDFSFLDLEGDEFGRKSIEDLGDVVNELQGDYE